MSSLAELRGNLASRITRPALGVLSRTGLKPDVLTLLGLAINIGAACLIAIHHFLAAGILILLAGLFDLLDGALARFTNRSTKFGALLDSVTDRISEAAIFCGLLVWYMSTGSDLEIVLVFAALVGSFLVSYIRARAEGMMLECHVGLFTRAERVIVLAAGLILDQVFIALWVLVVFVYVTVVERLFYIWRKAKAGGD
ncbi:MAG: CDP-alcohol phosphatidyltransferase family protein [Dehalococcoidia bacterium]|nr:MAG: CDP-alcohol phosphatidyltransferase family protein [Dehalococcoidia bacterium]